MYFKPKIFISSTLDLSEIRQEIQLQLESSGAEVMLYEKNLTPSITPATYRQDVLDADFIIFIFDERYGSRTKNGISGTNEEWLIVKDSNIPKHVYIRKNELTQENALVKFVNKEIKSNQISYYLYKDFGDLINRIKGTIFSIALDIAINKWGSFQIDEKIIRLAKMKHDYDKGLSFIKQFDEIIEKSEIGGYSLQESTIISEFIFPWAMERKMKTKLFIDEKINDTFSKLLEIFEKFIDIHENTYTSNGDFQVAELTRSHTNIEYQILFLNDRGNIDNVTSKLQELLSEYCIFKKEFQEIKFTTDIVS